MNADSESTSRSLSVRQGQSLALRQNALVTRALQDIVQLDAWRAQELLKQGDALYESAGCDALYESDDYTEAIAKYTEAIAKYTEAIRLDPQLAKAFCARGRAYLDRYNDGDTDHAIADWSQAIRLDPQDAIAYKNRGEAHDDKGDYDEAITDQTVAIRLKPSYVLVHRELGFLALWAGGYIGIGR